MIGYNEFAEEYKEKYPEYSNVDNLTLTKKIIEDYPEWQSSVIVESPVEIRDRAKKEYASDVLQQDSLNAIEIKEAQQQIWKENVFLPSILIVFLFLYFLPTYICFKRKVSRKKTSMIFFLNLFSGWTFFMWLILGIWSLSDFELK